MSSSDFALRLATAPVTQFCLETIAREAARRALQKAIEDEVAEYINGHRQSVDDQGHRLVVRNGHKPPSRLEIGAMIEVPSLLFELDHVLPEADFVSIGSNDLIMFLNAADRANSRVSKAYDPIALPRLRALRHIVDMARRFSVPITMCGELAGRTVDALALMSIGMTRLSMSPSSIGPIKEMVLGMELAPIQAAVAAALSEGQSGVGIRELLMDMAQKQELVI